MDSRQIVDALRGVAPDGAIDVAAAADGMPAIYVARDHGAAACLALRDRPDLGFSLPADLTAVDYLPREPRFEVMIHLGSLGGPPYRDTARRYRVEGRLSA